MCLYQKLPSFPFGNLAPSLLCHKLRIDISTMNALKYLKD